MFILKYLTRNNNARHFSSRYLKESKEKGFNRIKTLHRDYLINLKEDKEGKSFFKFCEVSFGKRVCMYFGASGDSQTFVESLHRATAATNEEVFASWTSKMFPERSMTMQKIKDNFILITEESMTEGKFRTIHFEIKLLDTLAECIKLQLNPDQQNTSYFRDAKEVAFKKFFYDNMMYYINLKRGLNGK